MQWLKGGLTRAPLSQIKIKVCAGSDCPISLYNEDAPRQLLSFLFVFVYFVFVYCFFLLCICVGPNCSLPLCIMKTRQDSSYLPSGSFRRSYDAPIDGLSEKGATFVFVLYSETNTSHMKTKPAIKRRLALWVDLKKLTFVCLLSSWTLDN